MAARLQRTARQPPGGARPARVPARIAARAARGTLPLLLALALLACTCAAAGAASSTAAGGGLRSWFGVSAEAFAPVPTEPPPAPDARAASTSTSCTPSWGSFRVGNWPPACWHPYGPSSPFNFVIPASPRVSSESAAIIRYIKGHAWAFDGDEAGKFTLEGEGSRPVYWSTSGDPIVRVTCRVSCHAPARLLIPAGARPQEASDGHLTVVDQSGGHEYDFWQATKPENGRMTVSAGSTIPIGAESGTGIGGDGEAAHLGLLGGLIRGAELAAGKIEHALVTTVKCVQQHDVWPSPSSGTGDAICPNAGLGPHFASLLQLNMSESEISATGAPPWQQVVMRALARYGVYVVDTQNSKVMALLAEDDLSFTSFGNPGEMAGFVKSQGGTGQLVGIPIETSKLRVIDPCVPQRTC